MCSAATTDPYVPAPPYRTPAFPGRTESPAAAVSPPGEDGPAAWPPAPLPFRSNESRPPELCATPPKPGPSACLETNPLAPARIARSECSTSLYIERTRVKTLDSAPQTLIKSSPSEFSQLQITMTRSGLLRAMASSASCRSSASPHTIRSGSAARSSRNEMESNG